MLLDILYVPSSNREMKENCNRFRRKKTRRERQADWATIDSLLASKWKKGGRRRRKKLEKDTDAVQYVRAQR